MSCKLKCLLLFLVVLHTCGCAYVRGADRLNPNGLLINYYNTTCPNAESLVHAQMQQAWKADRSITPALLRLVYSDCFVSGCDASLLLDGQQSEKSAPQNSGLRGFQVIDTIKQALETKCPGVVSCSDILHLAARDAVALAGGWNYPVFTGRRDGSSSDAKSVDLPPPDITWDQALVYFQSRGLDVLDLGSLLGAHTVGYTHCNYVHGRIYNFNDTGLPDASMDCSIAKQMGQICPYKVNAGQPDPVVYLNPTSGSKFTFENSYYTRILNNQSVLQIDQEFSTSRDGVRIAAQFSYFFEDFKRYFAFGMNRMGSIGVLTKNKGEIRRNCRLTNANNPRLK